MGRRPDNKYSARAFPLLTQRGSRASGIRRMTGYGTGVGAFYYWVISGPQMLKASLSAFDPKRTCDELQRYRFSAAIRRRAHRN
jgi:hypothetical protein